MGLLTTRNPNDDIELGHTAVTVTLRNGEATGVATSRLRWLPTPRVEIIAEFDDGRLFWIAESDEKADNELPCWFEGWRVSSALRIRRTQLSKGARITGELAEFGVSETSADCERVVFHLANLPAIHATDRMPDGREHVRPTLTLRSKNWQVVLEAVENLYSLEDQLREGGGYAITHHGTLSRTDGGTISSKAAVEALQWLGDYLSFSFGYRVAPLLARGYVGAAVAWEERRLRRIDPWQQPRAWIDRHHGEALEQAFAGFANLAEDETWAKPIESAVYWYGHANVAAGGVETSIILAQAALELLAWTRLVQDQRSLSTDGAERLTAADKIRLALSAAGIPLAIPDALTELRKTARGLNIDDGPAAITGLRNAIVHPNVERRAKLVSALGDAWLLSQWYVELLVLRYIRYDGLYSSRLTARWAGEVERVPWARPADRSPE